MVVVNFHLNCKLKNKSNGTIKLKIRYICKFSSKIIFKFLINIYFEKHCRIKNIPLLYADIRIYSWEVTNDSCSSYFFLFVLISIIKLKIEGVIVWKEKNKKNSLLKCKN